MKKQEQQLADSYGNSILFTITELRPLYRLTKSYHRNSKIDSQIKEMKESGLFDYEEGNDAPKGGQTGEFHKFTPKVKRLGLKRKIEREQRELAARVQIVLDNEESAFNDEFETLKPLAREVKVEIEISKQLMGAIKSEKQSSIMKAILEKAGVERSVNFWRMWVKLSRYTLSV